MAKIKTQSGLPDALERRELLYGSKRNPDFEKMGLAYFKDGRRSDALEYFEKLEDEAKKRSLIKTVRDDAIKEGNHFVLNRAHNNVPLEASDWLQAAKNARERGKLRYALSSAERANDEALVAELMEELGLKTETLESESDDIAAGIAEAEAASDEAEAASDEAAAASEEAEAAGDEAEAASDEAAAASDEAAAASEEAEAASEAAEVASEDAASDEESAEKA